MDPKEEETRKLIAYYLAFEEIATRDRKLALSSKGIVPEREVSQVISTSHDAQVSSKLHERLTKELNKDMERFRISCSSTATDDDETFTEVSDCNSCIVCCEASGPVYEMPCGHYYCVGSVKKYGNDEDLVPITCCQEQFPDYILVSSLTGIEYENYKEVEVGKKKIPECELDKMFDEIIRGENLAVCPGCGGVIEKVSGCNHMTCICKREFDYSLNKKIKS